MLIPKFGALGAAWGTAVTYLFITATYLAFTQYLHPLEISWKRLTVVGLSVTVLFAVALAARQPEFQLSFFVLKCFVLVAFCCVGVFILPFRKVFS